MRMNEDISADVLPMNTDMITTPTMRLDSDRFMPIFLSEKLVYEWAAGNRRP